MEDYEIIKRLGGGSFADVFLAKEKSTSDMVAIKVLKKNIVNSMNVVNYVNVKVFKNYVKIH
jgi:serine/threonine protein kinase